MIDEISILGETFEPDAPSFAAEERARASLQNRIGGTAPRRRRSLRLPMGVGMATAAAVVAAFAINGIDRTTPGPPPVQSVSPTKAAAAPYLRPVSAAQVLENAAWSAEQGEWTDPTPQQFMYVETLEMRNQPPYEQKHPNGALLPGKAQYRKIQVWDRVDGQVQAHLRNGKLTTQKQGENRGYWARLSWPTIAALTTPDKVRAWVANPGPIGVDPDALAGQYVLPPAVKAAIFRYLAGQPGMKTNPAAVTIDGRPAIGLGRVVDGYLAQELLFDKQTYALLGERLIAIAEHTTHADDGTVVTHKGDLFRQVIYRKLIIVDHPGDTA